ncbi:UNVERIFIED_CONTAM: hypothetical protein FKN15_009345 [Acipenser sinensis]
MHALFEQQQHSSSNGFSRAVSILDPGTLQPLKPPQVHKGCKSNRLQATCLLVFLLENPHQKIFHKFTF